MQNVKTEINGKILTITVDLSYRIGPSKSGKSQLVASTQGNVFLADANVTVGLNIYTKETK
jgi:hypothetical protein